MKKSVLFAERLALGHIAKAIDTMKKESLTWFCFDPDCSCCECCAAGEVVEDHMTISQVETRFCEIFGEETLHEDNYIVDYDIPLPEILKECILHLNTLCNLSSAKKYREALELFYLVYEYIYNSETLY